MTGQGTDSFNGTYAGPLAAGAIAEIIAGTANLSAYGTYNFGGLTPTLPMMRILQMIARQKMLKTMSLHCVLITFTQQVATLMVMVC